jgi:hypothetical protein
MHKLQGIALGPPRRLHDLEPLPTETQTARTVRKEYHKKKDSGRRELSDQIYFPGEAAIQRGRKAPSGEEHDIMVEISDAFFACGYYSMKPCTAGIDRTETGC